MEKEDSEIDFNSNQVSGNFWKIDSSFIFFGLAQRYWLRQTGKSVWCGN